MLDTFAWIEYDNLVCLSNLFTWTVVLDLKSILKNAWYPSHVRNVSTMTLYLRLGSLAGSMNQDRASSTSALRAPAVIRVLILKSNTHSLQFDIFKAFD